MVLVRGVYEQLGNTLALWTDTGVDRALGGFTMPMTWFQSINPLVIILGTPVILSFWARAAERGNELSSVAKMSLGAVILAAAFLALAGLSLWLDGTRAHWSLLALFIFAVTVGASFTSFPLAYRCLEGWRPNGSRPSPSRSGFPPPSPETCSRGCWGRCGAGCRPDHSSRSSPRSLSWEPRCFCCSVARSRVWNGNP